MGADRRANALQGELEESRALLDSADRAKKACDMELGEARGAVNDMTTINSKAGADKRRLEGAIHTMHAEIDDMLSQAKSSEEKAKRAMVDAARLADELRAEQEHSSSQEKAKRALESQIAELEQRFAEANDLAAKGGRNAMAKLESRIRELEIELGTVQSKTSETYKAKRLSATSRNSNSKLMKTTRTKTVCLSWPTSSKLRSRLTRSKLRRLKSLLPSTWPSSARLNKSLRKPKKGPRWQELPSLMSVKPMLCKMAHMESTAASVIVPLSPSRSHG